jgi:hypothetical protein
MPGLLVPRSNEEETQLPFEVEGEAGRTWSLQGNFRFNGAGGVGLEP